ncbi:wd-40 repeat protein [Stylonychia lemnae]|uniref:Wd-40 repeat protein n=1 Tax=Stylonychia lemnae TaxID=5949 RepID=A0A078ACP2_STYLE|nr:wd-40 repeat protein [Stylonychia lemnae]|eukprot:CDW78608.1 wd-40 repeat protein [Stylonychia lemnae]
MTIETTDIYQIHKIFKFKEGSSFANDYVCLVLKVIPKQLIDFYGGQYLFQIWKNKERLFQHAHQSQVCQFYGTKTEIVYLTEGERQNIIIIRPYLNQQLEIVNPFFNSEGVKLFVNDEYLIVSQENKLMGISLEQILEMNNVVYTDPLVEYENEFENMLSLNESGSSNSSLLRGTAQYKSGMNINLKSFQDQDQTRSEDEIQRTNFIQFMRAEIQPDLTILAVDYDLRLGHNIMVYASNKSKVEIIIYELKVQEEQIQVTKICDHLIKQLEDQNDSIISIQMIRKNMSYFISGFITRKGKVFFLMNLEHKYSHIEETITNIEMTNGYLLSIMKEKFTRLHGLSQWLHYISQKRQTVEVFDRQQLEYDKRENYFGRQENEIMSINFMNINHNQVYDILAQYEGKYMTKLILYELQAKIIPIKSQICNSLYTIDHVMTQCDYLKFREYGGCKMTIMFQGQKNDKPERSIIFGSNENSRIVEIVNDIDYRYRLVSVPSASVNMLFLADTISKSLMVFSLSDVNQVLDQKDLWDYLTLKVENFDYLSCNSYFLDSGNLYYLHEGNMVEINLNSGKKFTFDFKGNIKALLVIEGKSVYLRCHGDFLYYFDLDWIFNKEIEEIYENSDRMLISDRYAKLVWSPIVDCESLLIYKFEFDILANKIATFSSPWTIQIFNPMNQAKTDLIASHDFCHRFLTFNVHKNSPSTYLNTVVALDNQRNELKIWSSGTGFLKDRVSIKNHDYKGFQFLNYWGNQSLIFKVIFNGSKVTFLLKKIENEKVEKIQDLHINLNVPVPLFFSPDFSTYIDYNDQLKELQLYQLKRNSEDEGYSTLHKYQRVEISNQIDINDIMFCGKTHVPFINLESNDRITYFTKMMSIQSIPLFQIAKDNKHLIDETFIQAESMAMFQRTLNAPRDMVLASLTSEETIQLTQDLKKRFFVHNGKFAAMNQSFDTFILGNLRTVQSFTFYHWRVIDLLENDQLDIEHLSVEVIQELLNVVLPNGDTMIHILIKSNIAQFEKLLKVIENARAEGNTEIKLHFMPNLLGITPLHLCIKNQYSKAAGSILMEIGNNALDDHVKFIKNTFADLLVICPLALGDYLDMRLITPPWALTYTKGHLIKVNGSDFAVLPSNLRPIDEEELNQQLFQQDDGDEDKDVRMPMIFQIADLPCFHHFNCEQSMQFLKQLSLSHDVETLFGRKYIQAMLEMRLPLIRRAIVFKVFLPYLIYLILFSVYSQFLMFNDDMTSFVFSNIIEFMMIVKTIFFLLNTKKQFNNLEQNIYTCKMWNYFDIFPKFLVIISIILKFFDDVGALTVQSEINVLNSFASFSLWINLLYFCRIFRRTGHLIQMIIEVVKDMKYFLGIVFLTLMSFSGAFFILSKNNDDTKEFITSFFESNAFVYRLILGDFDTTNFGEKYVVIVWMFFMLATLFLIIIMLNLLIAIISDTFERVQGQAKQRMYKEFAQLIIENIHLLSEEEKTAYDQKGQYLYIASLEIDENSSSDIWEGKISEIKKLILKKTDQMTETLECNIKHKSKNIDQNSQMLKKINANMVSLKIQMKNNLDQQIKSLQDKHQSDVSLLKNQLDKITLMMEAQVQEKKKKSSNIFSSMLPSSRSEIKKF